MLAELKQVSRYYGQPGAENFHLILDRISLEIAGKESLAITGPSGSGKSTLLNILGTLDRPSSGDVFLDGTNAANLDADRLAGIRSRFIGFVFQLHHLLPQLTLRENVLLPLLPVKDRALREEGKERAIRLLERVGLKDHMHRRPPMLSTGECQRAAVVRALVNRPRLLLADEPTGSLDSENARQLGQLLGDLNREEDLAVVVVTHSSEIASCLGKTYRLKSGKLYLDENG